MDKFISKSKYSKESHKDFYLFHLFNKTSTIYFFIILNIFLLAYASYFTVKYVKADVPIVSIILIWVIVLATIIITFFQMTGRIKKSIRRESEARGDSYEIIEITKAVITRRIEGIPGREVIGWEEIESIYESEKYIFIYTHSDQGFLIIKEDIIEGNVDGLRSLAQNNMTKNRKGKVKYKMTYKEK